MVLLNSVLMLLAIGMTIAVIGGVALSLYLRTRVDTTWDEASALPTGAGASQLYYYEFEDRAARVGTRRELEGGRLDGGVHVIPVTYGECPQALIDAFVAIEDQQFFAHHGVNWPRTLSAAVNYCLGYTRQFGASTITQQLIKNLTDDKDTSVKRKLREIMRALELEQKYEKDDILEMYLNTIYFGQGAYGVQQAAKTYFNKELSELTLAECASIAGIVKNPYKYDLIRFPEYNAERRANVLGVYRAVNTKDFEGKRLLLIDDVCTSGSTLGECARVLRASGAADVVCLTLSMVRHK